MVNCWDFSRGYKIGVCQVGYDVDNNWFCSLLKEQKSLLPYGYYGLKLLKTEINYERLCSNYASNLTRKTITLQYL